MTDRIIEVEVACPQCHGAGRFGRADSGYWCAPCDGRGSCEAAVIPGTKGEAMYRLAEAFIVFDRAPRWSPSYYEAGNALRDTLAAVQAFDKEAA